MSAVKRSRLFVLLGGFVVACLLSTNAVATKRPPLKHVTIFGDSSAAVLNWDPPAKTPIERGNRVTYALEACGRLTTPGCLANGQPPSTLSEVKTLGRRIGPTVVILVGYNDDPHVYASGIDSVLRAMHKRGVKQVLWLTLRPIYNGQTSQQYLATNQVIRGAAHRFPFVTVVNWAGYSRPHPEWFGSDGVHFTSSGGVQFGIFVHRTLKSYGLTGPKRWNTG